MGERIWAAAGDFNWDKVLRILRKQNPGTVLPDDFMGDEDQHTYTGRDRAEELLRGVKGSGWTSLEDSIAMNIESVKAAELSK